VTDWIDNPESYKIARILQEKGEQECEHGKTVCYTHCGVSFHSKTWYVIPYSVRRFHTPGK
jgi:hypothetical protein